MALDQAATDAAIAQDNETFNNLIAILGEGSVVGKAVALTQATIKGIEGVQNAYTTAQSSPITIGFPAYPYVQAGLAGVFAAAQIKSIIDTPNPVGVVRGSGPAVGPAIGQVGTTIATPTIAPAPTADAAPPPEQQTIVAVTADGDVSNSTERTARYNNMRRLSKRNGGRT